MKQPHEFYLGHIGRTIDMDGYFGGQCWDFFAKFCKDAGYPIFNCTSSGYVKDIWNNRNTSGILKYFDVVSVSEMQDGDWIIWGNCKVAPYSHIAMFRKYESGKTSATVLGQNQSAGQVVNQEVMSLSGVIGVLRPKCYVVATVKGYIKVKAPATFTFSVDGVRIRKSPSVNGETLKDKGKDITYNNGQSVNYISYHHADGYTWIKYKRSVGGYAYVAIYDKNGNLWGKVK